VLKPMQCSACGMDLTTLEKEFGSQIVFLGGGVDTRRTWPLDTTKRSGHE
jgi:hypothetical protein